MPDGGENGRRRANIQELPEKSAPDLSVKPVGDSGPIQKEIIAWELVLQSLVGSGAEWKTFTRSSLAVNSKLFYRRHFLLI